MSCQQPFCPLGKVSSFGCEEGHSCDDEQFHLPTTHIIAGEYYVTTKNEIITSTVGSCVSACIRDTVLGIGGMNHFMLPERVGGEDESCPGGRYGSEAMRLLIDAILIAGGRRANLEVKLIGGGEIITGLHGVGRHNIEFVQRYVTAEGLALRSQDVGGRFPRKIFYFPASGRVLVKRLPVLSTILGKKESSYLRKLTMHLSSTKVEL